MISNRLPAAFTFLYTCASCGVKARQGGHLCCRAHRVAGMLGMWCSSNVRSPERIWHYQWAEKYRPITQSLRDCSDTDSPLLFVATSPSRARKSTLLSGSIGSLACLSVARFEVESSVTQCTVGACQIWL